MKSDEINSLISFMCSRVPAVVVLSNQRVGGR